MRSPLRKASVLVLAWALLTPLVAAPAYQHLGPVETLDNGVVEVGVAPQVGRVVSYRKKNGPEWLEVVDEAPPKGWYWNPWGGDRVWPTAQALCPQIYGNTGFDPAIDGRPWEVVSRSAGQMELRSELSPELGIQITRRIELVPGTTEVRHHFRIEQKEAGKFPVHVWTVTGIQHPEFVLMESDPRVRHFGFKPFKWWHEHSLEPPAASLLEGTRILGLPLEAKLKIGTFGRWIAALNGQSAFVQRQNYDAAALYLESSSLQAYRDPATNISELEALSPTWFLKKGETKDWTITWQLLDFPEDLKDPKAKALAIESSLIR